PEEKAKKDEERVRKAASRARREYDKRYDQAALEKLRSMGVSMVAVELPKYPYDPMIAILLAEAAAAFDDLTRTGRDKLLTEQTADDWPNTFRTARFIPAVEYIQANRARTVAMEAVARVMKDFDVIVAPTSSEQLVITNLTGHPAVILPSGFRGPDAPKPPKDDDGSEDQFGGPG